MARNRVIREAVAQAREDDKARRRARGPARITSMPSCKACGTNVPAGVDFCGAETCQDRARRTAPKGTREMGAQPQPPEGVNFRHPAKAE